MDTTLDWAIFWVSTATLVTFVFVLFAQIWTLRETRRSAEAVGDAARAATAEARRNRARVRPTVGGWSPIMTITLRNVGNTTAFDVLTKVTFGFGDGPYDALDPSPRFLVEDFTVTDISPENPFEHDFPRQLSATANG